MGETEATTGFAKKALLTTALISIAGGFVLGKLDKAQDERGALANQVRLLKVKNAALSGTVDSITAEKKALAQRVDEAAKNQEILLRHEAERLFRQWQHKERQRQERFEDMEKRPWRYPPFEHEAGYTTLGPASVTGEAVRPPGARPKPHRDPAAPTPFL